MDHRKDLGKPVSLSGTLNASVFNSLWYIVAGKRYELDDPEFGEAISLLNTYVYEHVVASFSSVPC
jgi:hypothetical protein